MEIIINSPSNPVFFHILNYPIRYYGIIISCAIFVGIILGEYLVRLKYCKKTLEIFQDSIPITIITSIIGARFFYVLGSFDYYQYNLKEIFMINHGGISIYGAIIFGIITIYIYSRIRKVSFLKYADFYSLVIPLCQAIGRFGNYFNQEAYGRPSNSFIKLFIDLQHRQPAFLDISYYHPTFLYEAILDFLIFVSLLIIYKKLKLKSGTIFALYLILYGTTRLLIENIRLDSILNINDIHIASIISLVVIIFGFALLFTCRQKP